MAGPARFARLSHHCWGSVFGGYCREHRGAVHGLGRVDRTCLPRRARARGRASARVLPRSPRGDCGIRGPGDQEPRRRRDGGLPQRRGRNRLRGFNASADRGAKSHGRRSLRDPCRFVRRRRHLRRRRLLWPGGGRGGPTVRQSSARPGAAHRCDAGDGGQSWRSSLRQRRSTGAQGPAGAGPGARAVMGAASAGGAAIAAHRAPRGASAAAAHHREPHAHRRRAHVCRALDRVARPRVQRAFCRPGE